MQGQEDVHVPRVQDPSLNEVVNFLDILDLIANLQHLNHVLPHEGFEISALDHLLLEVRLHFPYVLLAQSLLFLLGLRIHHVVDIPVFLRLFAPVRHALVLQILKLDGNLGLLPEIILLIALAHILLFLVRTSS